MILERAYFGAWLPRTMIHLEEVYDFLRFGRASDDLDAREIREHHARLALSHVQFVDNDDYNIIEADCDGIGVTITEDGVILLEITVTEVIRDTERIEKFYTTRLGPALAYLFSRGAPLPISLGEVQEIYPRIVVGRNISTTQAEQIFTTIADTLLATRQANGYRVMFGHISEIIDISGTRKSASLALTIKELVCYTVFIRGFSQLLTQYLATHRSIWEKVTRVREKEIIRNKDFTKLRMQTLDTLATISFVQARMKQMGNILHARERITPPHIQQLLHTLGFSRYEALEATLDYTKNLWQMTADYVNDTMSLLESVQEENSQRELRILQLATVGSVIVGFFGMNVPFPWQEEWQVSSASILLVTGLVILGMILFYLFIRIMIVNRRFVINRQKR